MHRFRSDILGADRGSKLLFSDFEGEGEMWVGDGPRERISPISFTQPFRKKPLVYVSLEMWDTDQATNQRVDLSACNVTEEGFDIIFHTWGDTRIARARASWLAIGELEEKDSWNVD
ncbi:MAG: H-type lectin domain-containing protein [Paracoccaceae bacterium]|nr:H-type lectin domain-containing protein [Paracoccaceae bacterium]